MRKTHIVFLLLILNISIVSAFDNFYTAKKWLRDEVYNTPGVMRDFYCNQAFGRVMQNGKAKLVPLNHAPVNPITKSGEVNLRAERIEWEHIVPAEQFGRQLKECRNTSGNFIGRALCRQVSPKFRKMEADPINLVPAIGEINADRSNFEFDSKNPNKKSKYRKCGVHIDKNSKKIQVPDRIKGQVARAYLHMEKEYGMELSNQDKKLFEAWDKKFPMTAREKMIRNRKMASVKKYQMRQKRRLASTSRRTSARIMNAKPKAVPKIKIPKSFASAGMKSIGVSGTKKALTKAAIKGGAGGIGEILESTKIPGIAQLGAVLQAGFDIYMAYNIEMHDLAINDLSKKTIENREGIINNTKYIERLAQEQDIMNISIENNTHKLTEVTNRLLEHDEQFSNIDKQLIVMATEIAKVDNIAQKNAKDIQQFKNGVFKTGIKLLDDYYGIKKDDSNKDYLAPAISRFIETKEIQNNDVKYLAEYYLIIARYEMYLKQPRSKELIEIAKSCEELAKQAEQSEKYLALLNSAYMAISDYEGLELLSCKYGLMDSTRKFIDKLISEKKFDDAENIAKSYKQSLVGSSNRESDILLQKTIDAKKKNFEEHKNFTSVSQAMKVIEENQNTLLNEVAVKYLYNESSMESAKRLLRSKAYSNEAFRIRAFAAIYDYLGKKEKLEKLVNLVENNPTYSKALKAYIAEKYSKKRGEK